MMLIFSCVLNSFKFRFYNYLLKYYEWEISASFTSVSSLKKKDWNIYQYICQLLNSCNLHLLFFFANIIVHIHECAQFQMLSFFLMMKTNFCFWRNLRNGATLTFGLFKITKNRNSYVHDVFFFLFVACDETR